MSELFFFLRTFIISTEFRSSRNARLLFVVGDDLPELVDKVEL